MHVYDYENGRRLRKYDNVLGEGVDAIQCMLLSSDRRRIVAAGGLIVALINVETFSLHVD